MSEYQEVGVIGGHLEGHLSHPPGFYFPGGKNYPNLSWLALPLPHSVYVVWWN